MVCHIGGCFIKLVDDCNKQVKLKIFNKNKNRNRNSIRFLTDCNSRSSTGCDDDDASVKLKVLSGIDASAMARKRTRVFSLFKRDWKISSTQ